MNAFLDSLKACLEFNQSFSYHVDNSNDDDDYHDDDDDDDDGDKNDDDDKLKKSYYLIKKTWQWVGGFIERFYIYSKVGF